MKKRNYYLMIVIISFIAINFSSIGKASAATCASQSGTCRSTCYTSTENIITGGPWTDCPNTTTDVCCVGAAAVNNCICSKGGSVPFVYSNDASFNTSDSNSCKTSCMGVTDAKYFSFSNAANVGFSRIYNCLCVNGSSIPFYYPLDSKFDVASDSACNQQCANQGTTYYSYSNVANLGTSVVTATPNTNSATNNTGAGSLSRCASLGGTCYAAISSCAGRQAITGNDNDCSGSQYCCAASAGGSVSFTNPLQFTTVEGLLGAILSAVQKIIVTLALVFIVIGAIMILTSAGSSGMVEQGKKAITMAMVGLAVGIAAPSILKELAGVLGWSGGAAIAAPTLTQIALNVLSFLLGITGLLALIMMVIGAIMYLTSAGDEDRIKSGKQIFTYAVIGIILAMAAMVIVKQIATFFL